MSKIHQALLTTILLLASGAVQAQVDCNKLVPDLQPRCEEVNRMNKACAGLTGDARKKCERENMSVPVRQGAS